MEPPEVDKPEDVANGSVVGAKNAAVRKLNHELGIPPAELPIQNFKFLTRLHYWAADTITHGKDRCVGRVVSVELLLFFCVELTILSFPSEQPLGRK